MKNNKEMQIIFKNYAAEFKQCKVLQRNSQYSISFVRNISTRKKYLSIHKFNCQPLELSSIIQTTHVYQALNNFAFIHKFVGYVMENNSQPYRGGSRIIGIYLLFQFGETNLDNYVQMSAYRTKEQSISLLHIIIERLQQICIYLSLNNLQTSYLSLDLKMITVQTQGDITNKAVFTYLPFPFIWAKKESNNFATKIYSIHDIQEINRHQNKNEIQQILQKNHQEYQQSNVSMANVNSIADFFQKSGLFLIKLILLTCQQINLRQIELELYTINKSFQIDYNWQLINSVISQCSQQKQYKAIGNIIEFFLLNKGQSAQQYRSALDQIYQKSTKNDTSSKKKKDQKFKDSSRKIHSNSPQKNTNKQVNFLDLVSKRQAFHNNQANEDIFTKKEFLQRKVSQLPNIIHSYYQNGKYIGQINEGKRQGFGIYYFKEGQIYGGQWNDDEMVGNGLYLFLDSKQYYQGHVDCGRRTGYGSYYYKDGKIYRGEWLNDEKEGYGQFYDPITQQVYKGLFKKNLQHGTGIVEYSNGSKFQGKFQEGMKNGPGTIYDSQNHVTFQTEWINDSIKGKVWIYFVNGDKFYGFTKEGRMHGQGLYEYGCGTVYQGNFINGEMSGRCKITYFNGDVFEGSIKGGKFIEKGSYYYKEANINEECDWRQGKQQGKIVFRKQNETVHAIKKNGKIQLIL